MSFSTMVHRAAGYVVKAATDWNVMVDNLAALWVGTTAGDMEYYSGAADKARVPIGTSGRRLKSNGSIPEWKYGGIVAAVNLVTRATDFSTTGSTAFVDITSLTMTLALPAGPTYSIFAWMTGSLGVTNAAGPSDYARVNIVIDGTSMASGTWPGSNVGTQTVPVAAVHYKGGVASGNRVITGQVKTENASETAVFSGSLAVIVVEETS